MKIKEMQEKKLLHSKQQTSQNQTTEREKIFAHYTCIYLIKG